MDLGAGANEVLQLVLSKTWLCSPCCSALGTVPCLGFCHRLVQGGFARLSKL